MALACEMGEIDICKWLYRMEQTTILHGPSVMFHQNRLSWRLRQWVCEWLFQMGAREDIVHNSIGVSPMLMASNTVILM